MKRWVWIVSITVFLLLCGAGGVAYYVYSSVKETAEQMYIPVKANKPVYVSQDTTVKPKTEPVAVEKLEPFNVLVMGVDEREHDRGRSDTIIVVSVNPNKPSMLMFNLPRDTRTEIVGHHSVDKMNHAYAFGGVEMALATVEKFLDMPIDYVVKINMEGFVQLVDLVGGVEVENPFAFNQEGVHFNKGTLQLDGEHALLYTRMRYDDPRGDKGRNDRQRQVLLKLMHTAMQWGSIDRIPSILKALGRNVKTNISFDEMKYMYKNYLPAFNTIDTTEVQGTGTRISNIYYYLVNDKERKRLHDLLKSNQ
ncbi:LCP family protein [Paenibacillus terrigena]|uniref:LCP family glycopolymer transferase n=1 Tax=Paenibacillus terrigena TaxID=369333 RepID=UPI000381FBC3|nr:LCP family protein [Paenibacillus terrigena]